MDGLLNFFSADEGRKRRQARDEFVGGLVNSLLGPTGIPERLGLLSEVLNPVVGIEQAGSASQTMMDPDASWQDRVGAGGRMASEIAGVVAPAAALRFTGIGGDDAARALEEGLLGFSASPGAVAGRDFAMDESGMFLGVNAKTADLDALSRAQKMTEGGASRENIWDETGWFQGVDGKWRFEIDDSSANLTDRVLDAYANPGPHGWVAPVETNISGAFDHPELYGAYADNAPFMGDATLRSSRTPEGGYMDNDAISSIAPDVGTHRSTILHELQHAVQDREGFARGGNLSDGANIAKDDLASKYLTQENALSKAYDGLSPEQQNVWNNYLFGARVSGSEKIEASGDPQLRAMLRRHQEMERLREMSYAPDRDDILKAYRRLAGEVEARNVQARKDMGVDERKLIPPWSTQDVADQRQIVRMNANALRTSAGPIPRADGGLLQ